jgi:hypothetical protein
LEEQNDDVSTIYQSSTLLTIGIEEPIWRTALRRSFGLTIDCACLCVLLLIPTFFGVLTSHRFEPSYDVVWHFGAAISKQGAPAAIGQFLIFTPFPLIYLRLVFKHYHCWDTPGEVLTGLATRSLQPGGRRIETEIRYGLLQYLQLLAAFILGGWLSACLITVALKSEVAALSAIPFIFALFLPFLILTILNLPKSRQDPSTRTDEGGGYEVGYIKTIFKTTDDSSTKV